MHRVLIITLLIFLSTQIIASDDCADIRSEIAKSKSIIETSKLTLNPNMAAAVIAKGNKKIAELEQQSADLGCGAAFSNIKSNQMNIDECVQKCQEYTARDNTQCFDVCVGAINQ